MKKNDIITLIIEDMLDDSRAFGRYEGAAVFVSGGVPGDRIRARLTGIRKNSADAALIEVIGPSPDRVESSCPFFKSCGGCTLRELSYDAQKKLKTAQVKSKLERLGGIRQPVIREIIGGDKVDYYRNKAVFAVGPHGEVGFMKGKSHFVTDIEDCLLQTDAAMVCADALRAFLRKTELRCITGMTVRTAFGTGEVMVILESERKKIPQIEELIEMLDDAVFSLSYDDEGNAADKAPTYSLRSVSVIHKGKCTLLAGVPTIRERITRSDGAALDYEISPQSFYQVNPEQMIHLYEKAAEYAALTGNEIVLDLYCGVGSIGIWLADKAEMIYGIEAVKPAVLDANRNSAINGIVNTRYICGKAEEELPGMMGLSKLYKWNEVNERVEREPLYRIDKVDVAVLDPPRAGCETALLDAVAAAEPDRIVYVSCDPGTLARDVKYLASKGYRFIEATPVDQFPMTSHVETVCLLSKGDVKSKKIRVEFSLEDMDTDGFKKGATYNAIRDWIKEKYGYRVTNLNIAQVKQKHGIIERENYNKPKSPDSKQPGCPEEKIKAIEDAMRHFQMI